MARVSLAFREAFAAAKVGELNFPTSLEASRRVLKAVENPDIGLATLAKIVVSEPLLSAKVIRLANSVALNPSNQIIRDVRLAVVRVGMDPIKALAMVLIMNQLRQSQRHSGTRNLSSRLWERSVNVAALAYVIAKKMTSLNPDEAMFAGIVHDLGRFYLLSQAVDYPELLENQPALAETVNDLAERATRLVLGELNLPASVVEAVLASRQYGKTMPPSTLSDVLFIARALSPRQDPFSELDPRGVPIANTVTALGLDQSTVAEVIAASGDEIYSIAVALES
ncbi:HDOD domain-containing protein [Propionivibrio sp.]|uniref:HDOD domain-containing protein n=1 Tax=Propionivibrio sp. TaxID=2212460 RepID=UPI00272EDD98|nr:HDOD domain-containing protein [Propionivibrio sp.]